MKNGILKKFFEKIKEWRDQRKVTVITSLPKNFNWDKVNKARSISTSPEELDELLKDTELSKDEKALIYCYVARNSRTFPKTLIELSKSENFVVREAVVWNDSAPFEALTQLSKDEVTYIRRIAERRLAELNSKNLTT